MTRYAIRIWDNSTGGELTTISLTPQEELAIPDLAFRDKLEVLVSRSGVKIWRHSRLSKNTRPRLKNPSHKRSFSGGDTVLHHRMHLSLSRVFFPRCVMGNNCSIPRVSLAKAREV